MKKKKPPEPDVIRFAHTTAQAIPGFTITNLSEQDIRELHAGRVPAWIHDTTAFWLRDNPKPSDVPKLDPLEAPEAVAS